MIGKHVKQDTGYSAFVPYEFPTVELLAFPQAIIQKASKAERLVGKLDGITQTLPDVDFFLSMYVLKDAAHSSQIEGTKATMSDVIKFEAGIHDKTTDADDILHYVEALNYSIDRLSNFPFSLRFIREIHAKLLTWARTSHFADPGEFRKSQNWIGGTTPTNALYVPPPVEDMSRSLDDFEKFIHDESCLPLLQIGLLHAQFETIHPFLDWNGRTGRIIVTLFLYARKMLEKPVLFLSSYFKKHQKTYYERLNGYHEGNVEAWLDFFLDWIIETAEESIETSRKITTLRESDMRKIQALGKRGAESGVKLLEHLYRSPIVTTATVAKTTGFTRVWAQKTIDRFIVLWILTPYDEGETYGRRYEYRAYLDAFNT